MTPALRRNLARLLRPRHVAILGGRDAETVAGELARIGYAGSVWPVNPRREEIGGHRCLARIEDLPEPPDAVFVAIPREPAIEAVAALAGVGAGGAVVYTAGFREVGAAEAEARLVAAAGDMALLGPNCYGLLNYVGRVALWPFARGGEFPGYGAAIVTQSGMLSSDLTMSQRSFPFAYVVSLGNQAVLALEDFVDQFADEPEVRAIGLHIEGLKDVPRFEQAARKALARGVPIVALKTGTSRIGARLTVSHTGSLSGTDALYAALFDRLGIIRVATPAELLETLKFLCVAGVPRGGRVAGFTCSGGGATMLADGAERLGIEFPAFSETAASALGRLLPMTATISNPLDYTTPIWGMPERTGPVFVAALADGVDAAVLVQDYPLPGLDESRPAYLADAGAFIDATAAAGVPAAICATIPENLDGPTRESLLRAGVAPMQGLSETLSAFAGAAWYGQHRRTLLDAMPPPLAAPPPVAGPAVVLDEAEGKARLAAAGVAVPEGVVVTGAEAPRAATRLGWPVAVKMVSAGLPHKTEAGAVELNLGDEIAVAAAVRRIGASVALRAREAAADRFLVERMAPPPTLELAVGVRVEPGFGLAMTIAAGGVLVELHGDATTLLLPADRDQIDAALSRLKVASLLNGHRGRSPVDRRPLLDALEKIAGCVALDTAVMEIEVNPLFVGPTGVTAVDVLMQVAPTSARGVVVSDRLVSSTDRAETPGM